MGLVYEAGPKYQRTRMTIFCMRTLASVSIFIFGILMLSKKKRLPFLRDKFQFNVMTLKQTLWIVLIFCLMNALEYLIEIDKYLELSIISAASLLIPVVLIVTTKQSYPLLWTDFDHSNTRYKFFMTKQTLRPRSSCQCESLGQNQRTMKFIYVQSSNIQLYGTP